MAKYVLDGGVIKNKNKTCPPCVTRAILASGDLRFFPAADDVISRNDDANPALNKPLLLRRSSRELPSSLRIRVGLKPGMYRVTHGGQCLFLFFITRPSKTYFAII